MNKQKIIRKRTKNLHLKRVSNMKKRTLNRKKYRGGIFAVTCGNEWKRIRSDIRKKDYPHIVDVDNNILRTTTTYTIEWESTKKKREIKVKISQINRFIEKILDTKSNNRKLFKKTPIYDDERLMIIPDIYLVGTLDKCKNRFRLINELFEFIEEKYKETNIGFLDGIELNEIILDHYLHSLNIKIRYI